MELAEQLIELAEVLVIAVETLVEFIAELIVELINKMELFVELTSGIELEA